MLRRLPDSGPVQRGLREGQQTSSNGLAQGPGVQLPQPEWPESQLPGGRGVAWERLWGGAAASGVRPALKETGSWGCPGLGSEGSCAGAEVKEQERCPHASRISQVDPMPSIWAQRGCQGTADKAAALRVFPALSDPALNLLRLPCLHPEMDKALLSLLAGTSARKQDLLPLRVIPSLLRREVPSQVLSCYHA